MPIPNIKRKIALSLLLAVALSAAYLLYTDLPALRDAFSHFRWAFLLPTLGLTALNLLLRYIKWAYYLNRLEVRGLTRAESVAIFLSNYALILTPGKMGGLMKSYFVRQIADTPMARTMPVILAERLTDGLGMVLMTTIALVAYPAAWPVVALVLSGMALVLLVAQVRPLALWLLALGERIPLVNRGAASLHDFYESSYDLLQWRPLLWATTLGTLSRALEGVALYVVLLGLGVSNSGTLFAQSLFVAALSNIVGVVVMLPGGLGGTEGSMTGLLDFFVGLAAAPAAAATLLVRLATFWFPALLGFAALWVGRSRFFAAVGGGEPRSPFPAAPERGRRRPDVGVVP